MPLDPPDRRQGFDDPRGVVNALGSAFPQLAYSVATVDRELASACVKDAWTKIDLMMVDRGFSDRDRHAVLSAFEYAEREIPQAGKSTR